MRESLSLFMLHHWRKSFWNGHYKMLIRSNGAKWIILDTVEDLRRKIYSHFGYSVIYQWSNDLQSEVEIIKKNNG